MQIINAGSEQLKTLKPFEWCYVGKHGARPVATYLITGTIDGKEATLFSRTVDMLTGDMVEMQINETLCEEAQTALMTHYSAEHVRKDGVVLSIELCADMHLYDANSLPTHPVYGRNVYHADVSELHSGEDWMSVM